MRTVEPNNSGQNQPNAETERTAIVLAVDMGRAIVQPQFKALAGMSIATIAKARADHYHQKTGDDVTVTGPKGAVALKVKVWDGHELDNPRLVLLDKKARETVGVVAAVELPQGPDYGPATVSLTVQGTVSTVGDAPSDGA